MRSSGARPAPPRACTRRRSSRRALSRQMLEARLQVMRAQIEPHFLFNTLANVKRLCQTRRAPRPHDARQPHPLPARGVAAAARRARPRSARRRTSCSAYLAVLQDPHGRAPRITRSTCRATLRDYPFPPMMLLTLAENAIKHGIHPRPSGGSIDIDARRARRHARHHGRGHRRRLRRRDDRAAPASALRTRARASRRCMGRVRELAFVANEPRGVVATIRVPLPPPRRRSRPGCRVSGATPMPRALIAEDEPLLRDELAELAAPPVARARDRRHARATASKRRAHARRASSPTSCSSTSRCRA